MKNSLFVNISDIKISLFVGFVFSAALFVSASSFAALTNNSTPANGGLTGGAFMHWSSDVLTEESLPVRHGKYDILKELENPTVKKARKITEGGTVVVSADSGNVGIGTESPSQLLEIKGTADSSRINITSGGNEFDSRFKLQIPNSSGTMLFDKEEGNLIFKKGNLESFSINNSGKVSARLEVSENNTLVMSGDKECIDGTFAYGFDEDANLKCR